MEAKAETLKPMLVVPQMNKELVRSLKALAPLLGVLICALVFHYLSGGSFLTPRNLSNLSRQVCVNMTLAVGMTFVILTAGIDLSVGSVLALSGMVAAISQVHWGWAAAGPWGAVGSFLLAMLVGGLSGGFTGFAVSRLKITPFIVTLGMMVICRGLTLIISDAQAVAPLGDSLGRLSSDYLPPFPSAILLILGAAAAVGSYGMAAFQGKLRWPTATRRIVFAVFLAVVGITVFCGYRGIPYMVFIGLSCAGAGMFALKYTRFGRFVYAIGGNPEAAALSGVPVRQTLWLVYLLVGCLAGLAGVMDAARVNGAVPSAGELGELDAIAAVVIGGTSLMGGVGKVSGTLLGVLIMGILNNGMSLIGVSDHYQKVFKGIVIILAVYLDLRSKRK
jgi:D-xylose transport system permease protein